jgi:hypothetical protein
MPKGSSISSASVCSGTLALAIAFGSGPARADDAVTEACLTAHTDGQRARRAGKLLDAKRAFLACAASSCPDRVTERCVPWLADVEQRLPTIVLDVRDENDRDLAQVKVTVDGKLLSDTLDGRSIPLDPGSHNFRFEASGFHPLERTFLLREGEHSRRIDVKLGSVGKKPSTNTENASSAPSSGGLPWTFWALGGVGLVGLGAGSYFFFDGRSDVNALRDSCAPACAESDVDDARTKIRTADVFLGVGVVALGAAAVIALTHDSPKEAPTESARVHRRRAAWPSF